MKKCLGLEKLNLIGLIFLFFLLPSLAAYGAEESSRCEQVGGGEFNRHLRLSVIHYEGFATLLEKAVEQAHKCLKTHQICIAIIFPNESGEKDVKILSSNDAKKNYTESYMDYYDEVLFAAIQSFPAEKKQWCVAAVGLARHAKPWDVKVWHVDMPTSMGENITSYGRFIMDMPPEMLVESMSTAFKFWIENILQANNKKNN